MKDLIRYCENNKLNNITMEGILFNKKMNIVENLENFWGKRYPDEFCENCKFKPCKCTNVVWRKVLNAN